MFKILTDDFGGSKKPSEYSVQTICAAVMNEKNKSAKSKLKTLFNDIFSFSSTGEDKLKILYLFSVQHIIRLPINAPYIIKVFIVIF